MTAAGPLLEVEGLTVVVGQGKHAKTIVEDVSFSLGEGESLGIVGESGSGKTVSALAVMGLLPSGLARQRGRIRSGDIELSASPKAYRGIRGGRIGMIFQDPVSCLSPVHTIGHQLIEVLMLHRRIGAKAARAEAVTLLSQVELPAPAEILRRYPHQLSGGMCQRVMIALALAGRPRMLVADEPTTALDVTVEAQIIRLLEDLRSATGMALLLITHDLRIIAEMCEKVVVMYAGHVVEQGPTPEILARPAHPYTRALIDAIPNVRGPLKRLVGIPGSVPDPGARPAGCAFAPRCSYARAECTVALPTLSGPAGMAGRRVRCLYPIVADAATETRSA